LHMDAVELVKGNNSIGKFDTIFNDVTSASVPLELNNYLTRNGKVVCLKF